MKKKRKSWILLPVSAAILLLGAFVTWNAVTHADLRMRSGLLLEAQLTADAISSDVFLSLSGTEKDLENHQYMRLKEALAAIRSTENQYRFVYLMGRKNDGTVYIIADSEATASADYSPPGQIYSEVPPAYIRVFDTGSASVEGPVSDRWGRWVSALAPVENDKPGTVSAVLGIDIDARAWNKSLFASALHPAAFTVALLAGIAACFLLFPARYLLQGMVLVLGVVLSIYCAWIIWTNVAGVRLDAFRQVALSRTEIISDTLHDIGDMELEGLNQFFTASEDITPSEFQQFTRYLTRNPSVSAWEWIPAVEASNKTAFEREARLAGLDNFEIWQKNPEGKRIPAATRPVYYPVLRIAPLEGNEKVPGYDLGSESVRRAAIEEAVHSGLASATEAVTLVQETGSQEGILIFKPVFARTASAELRGFTLAVLRMKTLLERFQDDSGTLLEISALHRKAPLEVLATTRKEDDSTVEGLTLRRPVFIFDKVFLVNAAAGSLFLKQHPMQVVWIFMLAGLVLTFTLTLLVHVTIHRRGELERLVDERTNELKAKEESYRDQFVKNSSVMLLIDPDDRSILDANDAALAFYGYTREHLCKLRISDINILPVADIQNSMASISEGQGFRFEFTHRLADGTLREVSVSSSSILFNGKAVLHSIINDITEQKSLDRKLKESEENFSTFFETMDDLIFIANKDGEIFYVNGAVIRKLGYSMEELNGMHVLAVHPKDKREEAQQIFGEMFAGVRDSCPLPLAAKDGSLVPVETRIWFGKWGGKDCIFGISKDISKEQASLQKFNKIFENNPALMAISSIPERLFTEVNKVFIEKTGFGKDELIGKTAGELGLFVEADKQKLLADTLLKDGFIHQIELKVKTKTGKILDGLFSGEIIESQGRKFFLTVMIDITERKRMEENLKQIRERFTLAAKAGAVGVWDFDIVNNVLTWDEEMYRLYGITSDQFSGAYEAWQAGLHPDDKVRGDDEINKAISGEKDFDTEFRVLWPNGEIHSIRAMAQVQRDETGRALHMVGTNWDITDQKKAETDLRESNKYLIAETKRANDLMVQAEAANQAKSAFLSTMSHEIRTPMNGVIGMTGLLLDTPLSAEQKQYAQIIRTSGEALLTLINDILDFSKIEAGKIELEDMDFHLRLALEDTIDILAVKAEEKGLLLVNIIEPDVHEHLRGDAGRLRQILLNLAGNAIKFTSAGSITIHTSLADDTPTHETLLMEVIDTGIGIPEAKQQALFNPFSQVDSSTSRKYGGTGLGLAISKQLAGLMGGTIGVKSEEGKGSNFFVTAVFEKREAGQLGDGEILANLAGLNILVVDDNETNRLLLTSLLTSWGCRFKEASDGEGALSLLIEEADSGDPFSVALLDMQMPNMDGSELGRLIKENPKLRETRLVMLTSMGNRGDVSRFAALGFSGYLTKPLRQAQLHSCIAKASGRALQVDRKEKSRIAADDDGRKAKFRILVAEDNMVNQMLALKIIQKLGYRVDAVADGKEVLDALEHIPYDLVLMDCQMPEMDGYEATRMVRSRETGGKRLPVIAMTANALSGDKEKCLAAGMDDYLSKPVEPAKISAMLDLWLVQGADDIEELVELESAEQSADQNNETPLSAFDRVSFVSRVLNDDKFARELIRAFLLDMPRQIEALVESVEKGDADQAGRQAHKIRGSAANMGGDALCFYAKELERVAKEGDADAQRLLLRSLHESYNKLQELLLEF